MYSVLPACMSMDYIHTVFTEAGQPACLPACLPSLRQSLIFNLSFHCYTLLTNNLTKNQITEEGFIWTHGFKGTVSGRPWQQEYEIVCHLCLQPGTFYFYTIQDLTPWNGDIHIHDGFSLLG